MSDWNIVAVDPDNIESVQNRVGFIPAIRYAKDLLVMPGEIGAIQSTRFIAGDPLIQKRHMEIRDSRRGELLASAALRAECAVLGHVRIAETTRCIHCGSLP